MDAIDPDDTDEPPSGDDHPGDVPESTRHLSIQPPFLWPEAMVLAGVANYREVPPFAQFVRGADLISGVLVDVADKTIEWLDELVRRKPSKRVRLVIVVSEACPTRENHLRAILELQRNSAELLGKTLDIRLLPITGVYGEDCGHAVLPPTTIQAHDTTSGETVTCIGSVGDSGHGPLFAGSLNLVFRSDHTLRDAWRKWFQYLTCLATPLSDKSCRIPPLVPPEGTEEAAIAWREFVDLCDQDVEQTKAPEVDPETGEVVADSDGNEPDPWDGGDTAVEALAAVFHRIYEAGYLVTVDEGTRIKPFKIPVKAALLGQQSQRNIGNLTQTQAFSLSVLDLPDEKELEKCRKITDAMDLLSLPLSKGNRFLPKSAKDLLDREIEDRNSRAKKALKEALGGDDVDAFIKNRMESIKKDLDQMYRELGQGDAVPEDKLEAVLDVIKTRLESALNERITPSVVYNQIAAPALDQSSPPENWSQPLSILQHAAGQIRKSLTDSYFPRNFSKTSFTEEECLNASNLFGDLLLEKPDRRRAEEEQILIAKVIDSDALPREKCAQVWNLVAKGKVPPEKSAKHHAGS